MVVRCERVYEEYISYKLFFVSRAEWWGLSGSEELEWWYGVKGLGYINYFLFLCGVAGLK